MNKCQHCGTFVPAEKAFCPNCSEPMEPEETPNRAHSFSSDMLATIRDDPEKYRQMLRPPVKQEPAPAESKSSEPVPAPAQAQPPVVGHNYPQTPPAPLPTAKSGNKSYLIFGIIVVVILVLLLVILFAFKII